MMAKKIYRFIALILIMLLFTVQTVSAAPADEPYVPYENYTYWSKDDETRKSVYNRPMYYVESVLDAQSLSLEDFNELTDVVVSESGNIYILDSNSRIVVLDANYKFINEITAISGGKDYTFAKASSIYVYSDETIYISDTENQRVIHCDSKGVYIDEYLLPDSPLIPSNFDFRPTQAVVDSSGYVYVLSQGSYHGALLYAPDKSFIGFYGANSVTNGVLGAIESLFNRMFPNNAKKSNSSRQLPFSFTDITIDADDFVYTATDSSKKAQIKKLAPGNGNNILNSDNVNFADDEVNRTKSDGKVFKQTISSLCVDKEGFIYCLDSAYGRIFVYDSKCNMLTAIGGGMGSGTQKGVFTNASAISLKGDDILVCDKGANTITIFARNDYGKEVFKLTKMTIDGQYNESREGWEKVLKQDKNLQIAYTGIAYSYIADGEYDKAIDMALKGSDREVYSIAFENYREEWLSDNFVWLFSVLIIVSILLVVGIVIISKKKIVFIKNAECKLMFNTLLHPSDSFDTIKEKGKGSVKLGIIVLLCFYIVSVLQVLLGGFIFTNYTPGEFNSIWVFVESIGIVLLWVVANWLVCTLSQGIGKMKEIFIVTTYSLLPIIFKTIIWTVLSNVLLASESSILFILDAVALIYAGLIFIIGMMKIHDYTMSRFLGTSLLTLLGMAAIVFILILVYLLVQQAIGFVSTIVIELIL